MINNNHNQIYSIRNRIFYGFLLVINDLVALVDFMFQGGATPTCEDEANIDASTGTPLIDINDLVALVAYMFQGGPAPASCF